MAAYKRMMVDGRHLEAVESPEIGRVILDREG